MRTLLTAALLLLSSGCGGRAPDAAAPDLAAPVLAPMAARERLLEDLEVEKQQARDRAATFDEVAERDR